MKNLLLMIALCACLPVIAQQKAALPHGTVYGVKPGGSAPIAAENLETYMDKKTRISTIIKGRIIRVTKSKDGWFDIDGGKGKVIAAHFKNMGINLPVGLKGKTVLVEGVAEKQFIADDLQHFAGDTVKGKKQHTVKTNPKHGLTFEATGLMVE
ncbi:DUF4920 domain-containing protein [Mucilaginibacter corticis]|uniref:DUF4920 domain-containing protein n=1 Tax=Mucilaginibacter corticis TaxID=2597670 RepID=A0A556MUM5_9SPHI|nr:DUF4920 domain-containing protein [Mucilaginibacter corticis]TSJ43607.1 DUF4920 domain-containing protein [Mucilaginibacter corticis]